jgi:hypothetical protein
MDTIKNWCSNKENLKIVIMIAMAIILLVILKNRFTEKAVHTSDASAAGYETASASLSQDAARGYKARIPAKRPARPNKGMVQGLKPPPFLKRDLFASRKPGTNPTRMAEHVEEVNLELTATLIDGQGALAIIGNEVLGMGEMIQGFRVTAIKKNEVILSKGTKQYVLRIKEE